LPCNSCSANFYKEGDLLGPPLHFLDLTVSHQEGHQRCWIVSFWMSMYYLTRPKKCTVFLGRVTCSNF